jgi:biotin-(acetyl-CoA carboxylase) ligase
MVDGAIGMTEQLSDDELSVVLSCTKWEGEISKRAKKINAILFEAVNEALKQVFREEGTKLIYDYLENNCHLKREEIAKKTRDFSAGLQRLLGSGALVVEKLILRNLYSKFGLKIREQEGYEFSDYIEELMKKCRR